jgi:hypothetical protein
MRPKHEVTPSGHRGVANARTHTRDVADRLIGAGVRLVAGDGLADKALTRLAICSGFVASIEVLVLSRRA